MNEERVNGTVLFFIAIFFARGPENFTAIAAFVDIVTAAVPDLAAAAFAAAGTLTPCIPAAMTWFVFTWYGRIAGLRHWFFMLAGLRIFHGLFTLAGFRMFHGLFMAARLVASIGFFLLVLFGVAVGFFIATLFTPDFAHYFHLIRMICNLKWQGINYLPISTYFYVDQRC